MVHPPTLHVLPKPHPLLQWLGAFPNLLDWPPTPLGCQPTSHPLSQTLICSYYLSLLDTLDSPCLHFGLWPSTLTLALSLTAIYEDDLTSWLQINTGKQLHSGTKLGTESGCRPAN